MYSTLFGDHFRCMSQIFKPKKPFSMQWTATTALKNGSWKFLDKIGSVLTAASSALKMISKSKKVFNAAVEAHCIEKT